jgi:predicted DNA-binding protein with PD1-like motif
MDNTGNFGLSPARFLAIRLHPGSDLREELEAAVRRHRIRAGAIVTAVGSLDQATLRLADAKKRTVFPGKLEIVSLVGTLCPAGVHLHLSASDAEGRTMGGHLLAGCPVYTTAEIVIADLLDVAFTRGPDAETGYDELKITTVKRK